MNAGAGASAALGAGAGVKVRPGTAVVCKCTEQALAPSLHSCLSIIRCRPADRGSALLKAKTCSSHAQLAGSCIRHL